MCITSWQGRGLLSVASSGWRVLSIASVILAATGCADRVAIERDFSREVLADVAPNAVFAAANRVFREYLPIADADRETMTIVSRPTDVNPKGNPTQLREVLSATPSRRRQIGELRITTRGSDVIALCRVQVQRLDTSERRAFRQQLGDDRPANNDAFAAEAGTSAAQRETWTEVGRNRELERQILASLAEQLGAKSDAATERRSDVGTK